MVSEMINRKAVMVPIEAIKLNPRNARTHPKKKIQKLAASILANGFGSSVLLDENHNLIGGHARVEAMKLLGKNEIPATILDGLTPRQKKTLALAENRVALDGGFDREMLLLELGEIELLGDGIDIGGATGFSTAEIDEIHVDFSEPVPAVADVIKPQWSKPFTVSARGDLWQLGDHRLLCGDARSEADHSQLMAGQLAAMACHDVPYNVKIADVVGRGITNHDDFTMASGEMSRGEYDAFLGQVLTNTRFVLKDGAVVFVFNDWRHIDQVTVVGRDILGDLINIICWVKSNPGMGSLYRSQHELIAMFKVGDEPLINNVELGKNGRSRSNVWRYPGANQSREGRQALKEHPTPKPVALLADAIKDCTARGDIVLDCFAGSGSILLAASRVGRRAYAMEIEPRFVDLAIRRWQSFTGKDAIHTASGRTFDECAEQVTAKPRTLLLEDLSDG
jgi:DNA modification methylase